MIDHSQVQGQQEKTSIRRPGTDLARKAGRPPIPSEYIQGSIQRLLLMAPAVTID